jgi:hypothetical protein
MRERMRFLIPSSDTMVCSELLPPEVVTEVFFPVKRPRREVRESILLESGLVVAITCLL